LLAIADDQLILGHRDSEWCGHAPIIEEDIAFANIALDEIGHAVRWYETIAGLLDEDPETYPDRLVYTRSAGEYRCAQIVELPNGDWAFSMLRQFFMDSLEGIRLDQVHGYSYPPLSDTAAGIRKEELYHLRHTRAWVHRLCNGTDESRRRMQSALEQLWPYTGQLLAPLPHEEELIQAGYLPAAEPLHQAWYNQVISLLQDAQLVIPPAANLPDPSRLQHTAHLDILLNEMQSVARFDPEAAW
jgi:ring-1,2-phenylacetyl-CoA epoxidase subunit PaaC